MPLITVKDAAFAYDGQIVLSGVSLNSARVIICALSGKTDPANQP